MIYLEVYFRNEDHSTVALLQRRYRDGTISPFTIYVPELPWINGPLDAWTWEKAFSYYLPKCNYVAVHVVDGLTHESRHIYEFAAPVQ